MEPQFVRIDETRAFELASGVTGQPLFGTGAMLNLIRFEPGATVPLHSHPHEQLGVVLEGMQALVVDGIAHEMGPFEAYVLPGGVEHRRTAGLTERSYSTSSRRCARTTTSAGTQKRRSASDLSDGSEGGRWPQTAAALVGAVTRRQGRRRALP